MWGGALQGPPLSGHSGSGVLADTSGGWGWGRSKEPLEAWPDALGRAGTGLQKPVKEAAFAAASAWRPGQGA